MEADSLVQEITKPPLNLIILFFLSSERFLLTHDMNWKPHLIGKFTKSLFADSRCISIYEGRCASSQPASARLFHPRPPRGRQAGWRVGSQGRRGRPAKPWTPVSAALLSTWEDQKMCLNEIFFLYSLPSPFFSSLLFDLRSLTLLQ